MAEKPILFSTAMVRAILDDDKTMTRRILKPQPNFPDFFGICIGSVDNRDIGKAGFGDEEHLRVGALVRLPYDVGDKLWVRETWCKDAQIKTLEKLGIFPDEIDNAGKASLLLDRLAARRFEGLTTPKQIRFLESKGFQHVGTWQFDTAKKLIDRIAGNGWKIPRDINPGEYKGE